MARIKRRIRSARRKNIGHKIDVTAYLDTFAEQERNEDNSPFLYSLNHLTPEQVVADTDGEKKKKGGLSDRIFNSARFVVIAACAVVFVYCLVQLVSIVADYRTADELYGEIAEGYQNAMHEVPGNSVGRLTGSLRDTPLKNYAEVLVSGVTIYTPPSGNVERVSSLRFQRILVYLEDLRQKNPDTFGYINIDNSQISYPVMQSVNNEYYLTHSFTGTNLKAGAIFADYRNNAQVESNQNLVIYGHNMTNGAMFNGLVDYYLDENFYRTRDIEISTFDGIYTFMVFSVYQTTKEDQYFVTNFYGTDAFVDFCEAVEAKSVYHRDGISFSQDDVLLTLSTCITGNMDGRYAIHAKLVKVEN